MLQAQGAKEDNNPEYAQIMQFLKNLQMQSKMHQQRQSMPVAQQQSPQTSLPTGTVNRLNSCAIQDALAYLPLLFFFFLFS
jgi:hypothetical protein